MVAAGIDVAKDKVDVALSDGTYLGHFRQDENGLAELIKQLKKRSISGRVVLEASGGYERPALKALFVGGMNVCLVQPHRARHFARAMGQLAKTDRVDALMLARMAKSLGNELPSWAPPSRHLEELRALVDTRRKLLDDRDSNKLRCRQADPFVQKTLERVIKTLEREIKKLDTRIRKKIKRHSVLHEKSKALRSVKGVGEVLTATVLTTCLILPSLSIKPNSYRRGAWPLFLLLSA